MSRSHIKWLLAALLLTTATTRAGEFTGELVLLPEGCQQTSGRICKLGAPLTYKDPNGLVWQADDWQEGKHQSGTTDGASIPEWAQPIIGDAYDSSYLKAAVIHDHYCYEENRVRSWRQTHRMFYDALIDLQIGKVKAKTMYYAVYAFGPHWVELVPGTYCGQNCINSLSSTSQRWEGDEFLTTRARENIEKMMKALEQNPDMRIEEIEARAKMDKPGDFFLMRGSSYSPTGPDDPNIHPHR